MFNDATCFKAVYIVCGYTDLRAGMDRLAALVETQTGKRPYIPDTPYAAQSVIIVCFRNAVTGTPIDDAHACGTVLAFPDLCGDTADDS